jgi:hypothetical protein
MGAVISIASISDSKKVSLTKLGERMYAKEHNSIDWTDDYPDDDPPLKKDTSGDRLH